MGRPRIVVPSEEAQEMFRLFSAGQDTQHIGKVTGYSPAVVQRTLRAKLGPLIAARKLLRAQRDIAAQLGYSETSLEYREGFEAGYRIALAHTKLHGMDAAWEHWNWKLLPWRDSGHYVPPQFGMARA